MILDQKRGLPFRKTMQGFMPKHLTNKMIYQCTSLPESASLSKRSKINEIKDEDDINFMKLKVCGKEVNNRKSASRDQVKNNLTKIRTFRVVLENPERIVNALVENQDRNTAQSTRQQDKVYVKTPKQIIASFNSSIIVPQLQSLPSVDPGYSKIQYLQKMNLYEEMIIQNPQLYRKIMMAYRETKKMTQRHATKNVNVKKTFYNGNKMNRGKSMPQGEARFDNKNTIEAKRNIAYVQTRQFQLAVNLTNKIFVLPPAEGTYKAYICRGNNGLLVKSLLKSRPWWSIRGRGQIQSCNLVWTEWKRNKTNNQLPQSTINQNQAKPVQYDLSPTSKMREMRIVGQKKVELIKKIARGGDGLWMFADKGGSPDVYLTLNKKIAENKYEQIASNVQTKAFKVKKVQKEQKMMNHVPGCLSLHSKKLLFYNLKRYYEMHNKDIFSVVPLTFHIKKGSQDPEFIKFCSYFSQLSKKPKSKSQKSLNVWICKPGENSNRGNGITVTNNLSQIRDLVQQKCSSKRSVIIQKYFENPFLYNRRKFDIRCYVLITTVNGIIKGYWYEEGYIRTSSKEFSLKNLENKYVHLTNDAIQKKSQEYGKFQNFNKVSYQDFEKYMENQDNKNQQQVKWSDTLARMKLIATDLIHSVGSQLNPTRKEYSFQIFGLDFMLDDKLIPFMIEANSNPCISVDGNILARIIPAMLQNAIKIAIDPVFPPPLSETVKNKYCFQNGFEQNKFQLVYDSFFEQVKSEERPLLKEQDEEIFENQSDVEQE